MEPSRDSAAIRLLADSLIGRYPELARDIEEAAVESRLLLHDGSITTLQRMNSLKPDLELTAFLRLIHEH